MNELVSFTSFFQALIIIFMIFGLVLMKFWPRNRDGSMMDPDEVSKKIPNTGGGISPGGLFIVLLITTLAVFLK